MVFNEDGFTLVELNTAMVAGSILVLAFMSILVFSNNESSSVTQRTQIQQDVMVLDAYIRKQLTKCVGDSLLIYADSTAEQSGTSSNSGTILHSNDIDGNSYRISLSNQNLKWQINDATHNPVDAKVINLNFQKSSSSYGKKVDIDVSILSQEDTLAYEWIITCRN